MDAARRTMERARQATATEATPGKKAGAPLDIRPAAARNKPKPMHATISETKKGKTAKRAPDRRTNAAKNQPKPTYAIGRFSGGSKFGDLKKRETNIETRQLIPTPSIEETELGTRPKRRQDI
jgi:hypothetical protein